MGFDAELQHTLRKSQRALVRPQPHGPSWHDEFRQSAYIKVNGLHRLLSEGDIVAIFSQFGQIIDVDLERSRDDGESRGVAHICFADQRSSVLAVDNMNGALIVPNSDSAIRVAHEANYMCAPRRATGAEGFGLSVFGRTQDAVAIVQAQQQRRAEASPQPRGDVVLGDLAHGVTGLSDLESLDDAGPKEKKKKKKKEKREKGDAAVRPSIVKEER